jgi:cytidylate kinase
MYLDGQDVTDEIRRNEISKYAPMCPPSRRSGRFVLDMQRQLPAPHNVIMDGRDIGTVVLPDADVKIFLTATRKPVRPAVGRSWRSGGIRREFAGVLSDLIQRDKNDSSRAEAPLRAADRRHTGGHDRIYPA